MLQNSNPSSKKPCTIDNIILRIKIQKMTKSWLKAVKKSKHRLRILKQWYETQKAYIDDLILIRDKIQKPLLQAEMINQDEDRILFPNIDAMLSLSKLLLQNVQSFINDWHPRKTMIGQMLIDIYKGFIIYRDYCNNFYKGQQIIKNIKDEPQVKQIQSKLLMDIQSYTIKPVQRPPKYQLLLREYEKAIPKDHPDAQFLKQAIQKYHDVNEENNKSMDLQVRQLKMSELDKKYGGIVSSTRVYLFDEVAKSIDYKVRLYIFNDLILVVKIIHEEKEEGYKKIFLDGKSFIDAPMDGKYFINKLFICGKKQNIHLNFLGVAAKQKVLNVISKNIHDLYRKQTDRNSIRKRTKTKMQVINIQEIKVRTQPKLRITVVGVQKRQLSSLNCETFYILKIQAPFPNNIFQYTYLKFEQLIQLQNSIKFKNKQLSLPTLDDRPQTMGYYDVKKNKTKIIEYREIYIQRFLNFILRSQQLQQHLNLISRALKINQQLWQFVSYDQPCTCQLCTSPEFNNMSFVDYQQQKSFVKSIISSPQRYSKQFSSSRHSMSFDDSNISSISFVQDGSYCVYNSLLKSSRLVDTPIQQLNTLSRRLMWVDCKMGRIDYTLLTKNQQFKNIKVPIYFMSLRDDEKTYVWINHNTTVHEVIEEIATAYNLDSLRDFGLFVCYMNFPRLIDRDEKLWDIIQSSESEYDEKEEKSQNNGTFLKRLNSIKKWGQEIIIGKKSKIYLRKYLFVQSQLQIKACQDNPQRYSLIIQQVFYRFKHQILILNLNDTKKLCALYYIITNIDRIPLLNSGTFQIQKLKSLIPDSKWNNYMNMQDFQRDIFMSIKGYWLKVQQSPERDRQSDSKIFDKVEIIYNCIITLVHDILGWKTLFFQVTNYDPATLPGKQNNLLLGINHHQLVIMRHKQLAPLVKISLLGLDFKVTVFSIFIDTPERVLRFDGQMMYDIKKLIEIYRHMAIKFNQHKF